MRKQTMLGEVRKFFHGCTEQEASALLWNATCFPFGCIDRIRQQLKEAHDKGGGTIDGAIGYAHDELFKAMQSIITAE